MLRIQKVRKSGLTFAPEAGTQRLRDAINKNVRGTTILIAHRITTIMNADQIIVMDKGRIVQRGTHETLSKEDGIYKRIYDTQRSAT